MHHLIYDFSQVKVLDLAYNAFETIPNGVRNFDQLTDLDLSHNSIFYLTINSLKMTSVTFLDLSHNRLNNWPKIIFPNTYLQLPPEIIELRLSYNDIGVITSNPVPISPTLTDLLLENCSLVNISSGFLTNLTNIQNLQLNNNFLRHVPGFESDFLEVLNVSRNLISFLPQELFSKLPNLKTLDVSFNHLKHLKFPETFSLEVLDVSYCNIERINVSNVLNLRSLHLRGNYIGRITDGYITNPGLEVLDLSKNSVDSVDVKAFGKLEKLLYLDMSMNLITQIHPDTFLNNVNLQTLNLSRNYLQVLSFRAKSLKALDVSSCEIQAISDASLKILPSLERLVLARNLIRKLPGKIYIYPLQYLDLSSNKISQITNSTFSYLLNLKFLNLRSNRFTSVFKTSDFPPSLVRIYLEDNLWHCNCFRPTFRPFYDYLMRPPAKILDNNKLTCHSPENVSGHPWHLSCSYVWYDDGHSSRFEKVWIYVTALLVTITVITCTVMGIRKINEVKVLREQQERERHAEEVRERIRRLRMQQREQAQQNAPDPRELVRPPSYAEAILLPRIDSTSSNLTASQAGSTCDNSRRKPKSRKNKRVKRSESAEPKPGGTSRELQHEEFARGLRMGTDESDSEVEESIRRLATKNDVAESDF